MESPVALSRHPKRPPAVWFATNLISYAVELHGDRAGCEDAGLWAGLGYVEHIPVAMLAHRDLPTGPGVLRKAMRIARLAGQFGLPILILIDEPGNHPADAALWPLVGQTLLAFLQTPTPVVTVICGEAVSGGALALCGADVLLALEHSYIAPVTPEAVAAILWRDVARSSEAETLLQMGDFGSERIREGPGAHVDPQPALAAMRERVMRELTRLLAIPVADLVASRCRDFTGAQRGL